MSLRQCALVGNRGIEAGQVDHTHRLGTQDEGIIADAFLVDLRGEGGRADLCEALFRIIIDAAGEQVRGHEVDRILQSAPHGEHPARAAVGIARRPEILLI